MRQEQHCRLKATDTEQWSNLNASETKVNKQGWGPRGLSSSSRTARGSKIVALALASNSSGLGL